MTDTQIELWFDFSCPYAYLASRRAPALAAQLGVPLRWKPMLLGGVFRAIAPSPAAADGPMPTLSPIRAAYNERDIKRWAEYLDEELTIPATHPMRTVRALRVLLGLPEAQWPAAIEAIYAAYWRRGQDITDDAVLAAALRRARIDDALILAAVASADAEAIKDDLRRRTEKAVALGIFGAPAWIIRRDGDHTLIWGQDRMPWVHAVATGWNADLDPDVDDEIDDAAIDAGAEPTDDAPPHDAPPAVLDFYYDVSSPFCYFGLLQLPALLNMTETTVRMHPILLGGLFRSIGTPDVPMAAFPEAKRTYVLGDMKRWARWLRVPFRWPSKFPQRTIGAQRLVLAAAPLGDHEQLRLAYALSRAMWVEDRDLEDEATLAAILIDLELSPELLVQIKEPPAKQALIDETAAAAAAGVFGVPTYGVEGHLTWGQDRGHFVANMISGWRPRHG